MVVLTIVMQKNGQTELFEELIPKVHFMKLISCCLANSWHNVERAGQISFKGSGTELACLPHLHISVHYSRTHPFLSPS